jgi:hypothetical protein
MSMTIAEPTLRRTCETCGREYRHAPVTADGMSPERKERVHLIACSWDCLEARVRFCGAELGGL